MKIEAFIIFKEATVLYMYTGTCIFREMYGQTSYMYVTVAFLLHAHLRLLLLRHFNSESK